MCLGRKQKKKQIPKSQQASSLYSLSTERVQAEDIEDYYKGRQSVRSLYFSTSQPRQTIKLQKKPGSRVYWREEDENSGKKKINLFQNSVNNKIDLKVLVVEHKNFVRKPNYFEESSNDLSSASNQSLQDLVVKDLCHGEEQIKTPKVNQFFYGKMPPRKNFLNSPKSNTEWTRPTKTQF